MRVSPAFLSNSRGDAIHNYIAQTSATYVKRTVDRLTRRSEQIGQFPNSGRTVPKCQSDRIREVIERPYRIIYHILFDRIEVLAVLHGSQDLNEGT
ncbi:MAG: type II toxin-antitoxin system RelE/ParE family toxin [Cyanobacteria bacterium J06641_5]